MALDRDGVLEIARNSPDRLTLWRNLLLSMQARRVAEVGVFRGEFAASALDQCPLIEQYFMIDPWRHLDDWDKPANAASDVFEGYYREVLDRTRAHEARRVVLRGRTTEVADQIPDGSLDVAYVDGDHTLRGIAIDLHRMRPKIRPGGWIGGDDFARSVWQHGGSFEPTMVFPFAVHFAEAVDAAVYALPFGQFLILLGAPFEFVDVTGRYGSLGLRQQMRPPLRVELARARAAAARRLRR